MTYDRPEPLTLPGLLQEIASYIVLLLGTALVGYLISQLPSVSSEIRIVLLLLEWTLIGFAVGYLLTAVTYLWNQFSFLMDLIVDSRSWSRLKAGFAWVLGWVLRAVRGALKIAIGVLVLMILLAVLDAALRYFGIERPDHVAGVTGLSPSPLEPAAFILAVLSLILGAWLIRGVSYFVQNRWHTALS